MIRAGLSQHRERKKVYVKQDLYMVVGVGHPQVAPAHPNEYKK